MTSKCGHHRVFREGYFEMLLSASHRMAEAAQAELKPDAGQMFRKDYR
jgi:hypothetical protein